MGRQGSKFPVFRRETGEVSSAGIHCDRVLVAVIVVALILLIVDSAVAQTSSATASSVHSSSTASIESQSSRKSAFAWRLGMSGVSFANEKDQAQMAGFGVGTKLRYRLLSSLTARGEFGVSLQTGYAQSRFGDNTPKSGISLKEAVLQYKPVSALAFQAGAIHQGHLEAPLLIANASFPGVLEKLTFGNEVFQAEVRAQQTIPTSTSLSTKTVDAEPTPYFLSESLTLKAKLAEALQLKAFGSHYSFRSLPSTVAYESQAFGNTVGEVGPNSSRFAYEFDGWLAGGESKLRILRGWVWTVGTMMIQNTKAPESYKNGQMTNTGFDIALPGEIEFSPKGFVFFNESDVAPAFYSSSELGQTNRQGWGASVDLKFKKEKFKIGADYVNADVINPSENQSRQQFIRVQFETMYEML